MSVIKEGNSWTEETEEQLSKYADHGVKRRKYDDQELAFCDHADNMKVAGFSLSAIEEMKSRVGDNQYNEALDQQLRQFQVLDEIGSDDDEGK